MEVLNAGGASDVVLLCEHASNHIPAVYDGLGLSAGDLVRHIAWDPGAAAVTRLLSVRLDAPAFLGTYSRLLIDLNRPPAAASSIVKRSEATDIPGNAGIGTDEAEHRVRRIFQPFHDRVSALLDARQAAGRAVRLVSIHSFTPVYLDEARTWHGGVLYDRAEAFGRTVLARLAEPGLKIGANVPYASSRDEDYGVPVHGDDRGIPALLIEIRNDLIGDEAGVAAWAGRIAAALDRNDFR